MKQGGYHLFPLGGSVLRGSGSKPRYAGNLLYSQITSSAIISNTAAETQFNRSAVVPIGVLSISGATVTVSCGGNYSTTGTPTLVLFGRLASGTQFGIGQQATCPNNAPNYAWQFTAGFVTRVTGATGTIQPITSTLKLANVVTRQDLDASDGLAVLSPVNLSIQTTIFISAQWGAADPTNALVMEYLTVRVDYPIKTS